MKAAAYKKLLRKELISVINSLSQDEVMRQSHILSQKVSVDVNSPSSYNKYFVFIRNFDIHFVKGTVKYFIVNLSSQCCIHLKSEGKYRIRKGNMAPR
jgi:hypothetical protein